jgi:hypothetical protein
VSGGAVDAGSEHLVDISWSPTEGYDGLKSGIAEKLVALGVP